jgi:hypothetical protein
MAVIQSIKTILGFFKQLINPTLPLSPIHKTQISLGTPTRPGLSAIRITDNIIDRKAEAGIPSVPSEEDLRMERIRIEEIVKELLTNAKVEIVVPENQIQVTVYSFAAGIPVPIGIGINDQPIIGQAKGAGIIR